MKERKKRAVTLMRIDVLNTAIIVLVELIELKPLVARGVVAKGSSSLIPSIILKPMRRYGMFL